MSGGGRCNFTHLCGEPENYSSDSPHVCKSALSRYSEWDFISLIESYRIPYAERKHGQLFCRDSAKDILNMLLDLCTRSGVEIRCNTPVIALLRDMPAGAEEETPLSDAYRYTLQIE